MVLLNVFLTLSQHEQASRAICRAGVLSVMVRVLEDCQDFRHPAVHAIVDALWHMLNHAVKEFEDGKEVDSADDARCSRRTVYTYTERLYLNDAWRVDLRLSTKRYETMFCW